MMSTTIYEDVSDMQVSGNKAFSLLIQESAELQKKNNLQKKANERKKRTLFAKVTANSIFFLFFSLSVAAFVFSLGTKPVMQAQGVVSEVVMKDDKVACRINGQDYKLSKNLIIGIDIPTSPRSGDKIAIYEVCAKTFAVSPLLEYDKIIETTKIHYEMFIVIVFFSICAFVCAFFISINIRSLKSLKK